MPDLLCYGDYDAAEPSLWDHITERKEHGNWREEKGQSNKGILGTSQEASTRSQGESSQQPEQNSLKHGRWSEMQKKEQGRHFHLGPNSEIRLQKEQDKGLQAEVRIWVTQHHLNIKFFSEGWERNSTPCPGDETKYVKGFATFPFSFTP